MEHETLSLFDGSGKRKYLSEVEVAAFLQAIRKLPPQPRTYCMALYYTGARRAEALMVRKRDVDTNARAIVLQTLKRGKGKIAHRDIRVPEAMISALDMVFDLKRGKQDDRLWKVTVRQANRWVDAAMKEAGLDFSCHALRHTFGVNFVMKGVPLTTIQKLMGHSDIASTSIYTTPLGDDERKIIDRAWES
jgi:integrase/recombinase XerD